MDASAVEISMLVAHFAGELWERDLPPPVREEPIDIDGTLTTIRFYQLGSRRGTSVTFSVPFRPPDRGMAIYDFFGSFENEELAAQFLNVLSTASIKCRTF